MTNFQLSIKKWALIFLILFLVIPLFITRLTVHLYEDFYSPYKNVELDNLDAWMKKYVLDDVEYWNNLSWQRSINEKTSTLGIKIRLIDQRQQQIFSNINNSNKYELNSDISKNKVELSSFLEEYKVYSHGKLLGVAYVQDNRTFEIKHTPNRWISYIINEWGGAFIWLSIFVLILIISVRFIKRKILFPLKEFRKATDSVSKQNFNFNVPHTPVKEINQLSEAIVFMQETLKESLDKQNEMEKERKIFISSIIHDLRTPLFSIRGCLEGIKKGVANTPEKINKYVDISYKKANILNELINDLHTFTTVNYIEPTPKFKEINIINTVDITIKGFYPVAVTKEISLQSNYNDEEIIIINGDQYLLSRALENIIGNAIRYTPNRGEICVTVTTLNGEYCKIIIKDTGIGILASEIPHIFTPLYRGEKSRNRKTGGNGLGLSIAKQIIDQHRGVIKVYSNNGRGTIFEIVLPIETTS
ncbi:sensor histidine kinase [Priestia megaterium]|uniref:sensor histidine kinase n=1 Tax=Priestia megaterium TaxID=1404 RepID=UPI0023636BE2|nr:HAMP domain-containing sensor histidine kinase [Priestia megaterium]MDD1515290.1 HAMP domain-containing sensor histidine kinase [Priestia megaterium]